MGCLGELTVDAILTEIVCGGSDMIWDSSNRLSVNELLNGVEWHVVQVGVQVCHRDTS
jgi:hypothetical protein